MNQYTKLDVGKLFKQDTFAYQEGIKFGFDASGGDLYIYFKSPTSKEVQAIKKGVFNLKLLEMNNILFLLFKFGLEQWIDVPFSPHLSRNKDFIPHNIENGMGYPLRVYLIDANTGILKVLKLIGLSTEISNEFREIYLKLRGNDFNAKEYDQMLNKIYSTYSTNQLVQLTRYKC